MTMSSLENNCDSASSNVKDNNAATNCNVNQFALDFVSSEQLNNFLSRHNINHHIKLPSIAECRNIPPYYIHMLHHDVTNLSKLFDGKFFDMNTPFNLSSMVIADSQPDCIMYPVKSIFGNRMFLVASGSPWFVFLFKYCEWDDDVMVRSINSLPEHIRVRFIARAQGLFDLNLVKVDANDLINNLFAHLSQLMSSSVVSNLEYNAKCFGLLLQGISTFQSPSPLSISSFLYNLLMSCSVANALITACVSQLQSVISSLIASVMPRAQLSGGETNWVKFCCDVGTIFVTILSVIGISSIPSTSTLTECIKYAALMGRGISGFTSIASFVSEHLLDLFDWCYEKVMGVPRDLTVLEKFESEVKDFVNEVNRICEVDDVESLRSDKALRLRIRTLRKGANNIHARLLSSKCSPKAMRIFESYQRKLEKIADKAEIYGSTGGGPRPEPVVIHIFGPSGCGKSHSPYYIACDILAEEGVQENPLDYVYMRNVEQEYWDGYNRNKKIVIYDDFGQLTDSPGAPNPEFLELIRMGNIAEMPLHMASLSEKNNTYFESSAIILTSNKLYFAIQSLTHIEAYLRRVDLRFEQSVRSQFLNAHGAIDEDKVNKIYGDTSNEEIYLYTPYYRTGNGCQSQFQPYIDPKTLKPLFLSYEQMSEMVLIQFRKKQLHSAARLEGIDKYMDKAIARRDRFYDAKANVSLSEADDFLITYWATGGYAVDYYTYTEALSESLDIILLKSESVWEFVDEVMMQQISLKFKKIKNPGDLVVQTMQCPSYKSPPVVESDVRGIFSSLKDYFKSIETTKIAISIGVIVGLLTMSIPILKLFKATQSFLFPPSDISDNLITRFSVDGTCESKVSGDVVTKSSPQIRVESKVSGDVVTRSSPQIRVENKVSGDVVTKAQPVIKVEGLNLGVAQAYMDVNAQEIISNCLTSNLYKMGSVGGSFAANICFIAGRTAICNWHVFDFFKQHSHIKIANPYLQSGFVFEYADIKVFKINNSVDEFRDLVLLVFPASLHSHKNIINLFVRSEDISKFKSTRGILAGMATDSKERMVMRVEPLNAITGMDGVRYIYTDRARNEQVLHVRDSYSYDSQTGAGDCGSLLIINDCAVARKICGIHIAGSHGHGYAVSCTKGDLERALAQIPVEYRIGFQLPLCVDETTRAQCYPEGEFVILGKSDVKAGCPSKTDIRRSPIYGRVDVPKFAPSVLKPIVVDGLRIDPLIDGLSKCGQPNVMVPEYVVQMAADHFKTSLFANTDKSHQVVLSYEQAITGTEDVFMNPMNRRSSPGFGWTNKSHGKIGKTMWLGDGDYILDNVELKTAVEERERLAREGIRAPHLWTDTLKVERRTLEKVKLGKTRVFSVGQMDYILLCRKYMLGFCAHVMHNRIDNGIAVGINPYSFEWTKLYQHLRKKGSCCVAGDFKNFDGTLLKLIIEYIKKMIIEWLAQNKEQICLDMKCEWHEIETVINVLFEELTNSIHICGDGVYQWTHSQPSGNPMTAIINSMYNALVIRVAYIFIFGTIEGFSDSVSEQYYGDDNTLNISGAIIDKFNQNTISAALSKIGMTYTDESKSVGVPPDYRTIEEISFLKRKFVFRNGRCDATLDLTTCLEMVNWVRGDFDHGLLTVSNVETACVELAMHDYFTFDKWTTIMKNACAQVNLYPQVHSYDNFRRMLFLGQIGGNRGVLINDEFESN